MLLWCPAACVDHVRRPKPSNWSSRHTVPLPMADSPVRTFWRFVGPCVCLRLCLRLCLLLVNESPSLGRSRMPRPFQERGRTLKFEGEVWGWLAPPLEIVPKLTANRTVKRPMTDWPRGVRCSTHTHTHTESLSCLRPVHTCSVCRLRRASP